MLTIAIIHVVEQKPFQKTGIVRTKIFKINLENLTKVASLCKKYRSSID